MKYHLKPNGEIQACSAKFRACPYGEEHHFTANSQEEFDNYVSNLVKNTQIKETMSLYNRALQGEDIEISEFEKFGKGDIQVLQETLKDNSAKLENIIQEKESISQEQWEELFENPAKTSLIGKLTTSSAHKVKNELLKNNSKIVDLKNRLKISNELISKSILHMDKTIVKSRINRITTINSLDFINLDRTFVYGISKDNGKIITFKELDRNNSLVYSDINKEEFSLSEKKEIDKFLQEYELYSINKPEQLQNDKKNKKNRNNQKK